MIESDSENAELQVPERKIKEMVYVKKWMRTRHAIMFRLSNKAI
jgi:polo-like kinase 1